jgi:hypothetical protein
VWANAACFALCELRALAEEFRRTELMSGGKISKEGAKGVETENILRGPIACSSFRTHSFARSLHSLFHDTRNLTQASNSSLRGGNFQTIFRSHLPSTPLSYLTQTSSFALLNALLFFPPLTLCSLSATGLSSILISTCLPF